jgi:tetratricopeptide (TPR) repeat protein
MGEASRVKRKSLEDKDSKRPVPEETGVSSILSRRYGFAVTFLLIALTALLVYSNTFHAPFLIDDNLYILDNSDIRSLRNFLDISGTRYVTHLTFALNYAVGGYSTFGYHIVNIVIHTINGFLVYQLVVLTFITPVMARAAVDSRLKYFIAMSSALVFISHPIQTQAVTYITQRFASLATLFYLLSLVLFVRWRISNGTLNPSLRTIIYIVSVVSTVLAMKTKEIAFTLPFIVVLYEFTFFNDKTQIKKRLLYIIPFVLTSAIIPLTLFAPEFGLSESGYRVTEEIRNLQIRDFTTISPHDYLITQFRVVMTYLRLLILPVNQHMDYDYPMYHSIFEPEVLLSFLFLSALFGSALYLFMQSRKGKNFYGLLVSFGVIWFFITLSVESSVIPIKDVISEQRLYLPSVGVILAFTTSLCYVFDVVKNMLGREASLDRLRWAVISVIVVTLSVAAYMRNNVWGDELRFWLDEVKKSPDDHIVRNNLGDTYNNRGQLEEAMEEFQKALALEPHHPEAHNNLGTVYGKKGLLDMAALEFKAALRARPYFAKAHYNLGLTYFKQNRLDEAIEEYKLTLKFKPDLVEARFNLGIAYKKKGLKKQAIKELEKYLRLNPRDSKARKILEGLLVETNHSSQ